MYRIIKHSHMGIIDSLVKAINIAIVLEEFVPYHNGMGGFVLVHKWLTDEGSTSPEDGIFKPFQSLLRSNGCCKYLIDAIWQDVYMSSIITGYCYNSSDGELRMVSFCKETFEDICFRLSAEITNIEFEPSKYVRECEAWGIDFLSKSQGILFEDAETAAIVAGGLKNVIFFSRGDGTPIQAYFLDNYLPINLSEMDASKYEEVMSQLIAWQAKGYQRVDLNMVKYSNYIGVGEGLDSREVIKFKEFAYRISKVMGVKYKLALSGKSNVISM